MAETQNRNQLKELNIVDGKFNANGKVYYIDKQISFDRWTIFEDLQEELMWALSPKEKFEKHNEIHQALNEGQVATAAVLNRELMLGISRQLNKRWPTALRLCCLCINTADEDKGMITEDQMNEKINDWRQEGYDINSFFPLALATIPGFVAILKTITQDTSLNQK